MARHSLARPTLNGFLERAAYDMFRFRDELAPLRNQATDSVASSSELACSSSASSCSLSSSTSLSSHSSTSASSELELHLSCLEILGSECRDLLVLATTGAAVVNSQPTAAYVSASASSQQSNVLSSSKEPLPLSHDDHTETSFVATAPVVSDSSASSSITVAEEKYGVGGNRTNDPEDKDDDSPFPGPVVQVSLHFHYSGSSPFHCPWFRSLCFRSFVVIFSFHFVLLYLFLFRFVTGSFCSRKDSWRPIFCNQCIGSARPGYWLSSSFPSCLAICAGPSSYASHSEKHCLLPLSLCHDDLISTHWSSAEGSMCVGLCMVVSLACLFVASWWQEPDKVKQGKRPLRLFFICFPFLPSLINSWMLLSLLRNLFLLSRHCSLHRNLALSLIFWLISHSLLPRCSCSFPTIFSSSHHWFSLQSLFSLTLLIFYCCSERHAGVCWFSWVRIFSWLVQHSSSRFQETRLINTSLLTLKSCISARASAGRSSSDLHIPYRNSKLTLLLRDCFELGRRFFLFNCPSFSLLLHFWPSPFSSLFSMRSVSLLLPPPPLPLLLFDCRLLLFFAERLLVVFSWRFFLLSSPSSFSVSSLSPSFCLYLCRSESTHQACFDYLCFTVAFWSSSFYFNFALCSCTHGRLSFLCCCSFLK